jgi:F0F1-type ATP synthase membrane subunit c/vacuolar-type H+-ATPase subunit K
MLEQVHDHIVSELGQSSRTDTIFVVTAVLFNLIVLGINSGVAISAAEEGSSTSSDIILAVFITMTLLLNIISVMALILGRRTRSLLLNGLVTMYHDNDVDKYYDPSLLSSYGTRYLLFTGVIATLALTAIIVPLIIRFV